MRLTLSSMAATLAAVATLQSLAMSQTHRLPDVGDPLPASVTPRDELMMTRSGTWARSYLFVESGITYTLAIDQDNSVSCVSVSDSAFLTSEGIHVGMRALDILSDTTRHVLTELGWAYYIPLTSGWNAAFTQGPTMTEGDLLPSARVAWLFKR